MYQKWEKQERENEQTESNANWDTDIQNSKDRRHRRNELNDLRTEENKWDWANDIDWDSKERRQRRNANWKTETTLNTWRKRDWGKS